MSFNYKEHSIEDRRLVVLRLLKEGDGYCNESILYHGVVGAGHVRATREIVREDLEWLRDRNLVTHEFFQETVLVAHLTARGRNVAAGKETVEGVKKPEEIG